MSAGAVGVISRTNGLPSLTIDFVKSADANTVEVVKAVLEELDDIKTGLPADIEFTEISNQAPEIEDSINSLGREVALGAALRHPGYPCVPAKRAAHVCHRHFNSRKPSHRNHRP